MSWFSFFDKKKSVEVCEMCGKDVTDDHYSVVLEFRDRTGYLCMQCAMLTDLKIKVHEDD